MWKRNPDRTVTARLPGIKCGSGGSGSPMMRSGLPSASICPNSKSYFPFDPQSGGCFGPHFFRSAASFSQQIPKLICERSCRMAKTLTVNITPILKKESRKTKKIKKKMRFPVFSAKKDSFAGKSACLARCRQNESTKKPRARLLRFLKREEKESQSHLYCTPIRDVLY